MFWQHALIIWLLCYVVTQFYLWHGTAKKIPAVLTAIFTCVLIYTAGFRSLSWPDTGVYAWVFSLNTSTLNDFSLDEFHRTYLGYQEIGFYLLSSIIRSLTGNVHVYFTVVSALSLTFLFLSLRKYSVYPLIGLLVYLSRFFMGREMMQIRAGLAISIVVFALQFIEKQKLKYFIFFVLLASSFHLSAILILPVYWMSKLEITPKRVLMMVVCAYAIAAFASVFVVSWVTDFFDMAGLGSAYTSEDSSYSQGKGLANPMIYYQTLVLLLYTFNERKLAAVCPCYMTIRNGYLYSTILLVALSAFGTLSGRTSTIFATFEVFILPSLIFLFQGWKKLLAWGAVGLLMFAVFYLNYVSYFLER